MREREGATKTQRFGYVFLRILGLDMDGLTADLKEDSTADVDTSKEVEIKDYFQEIDGQKFAGRHLLVELWDAENLNDPETIGSILSQAATDAKATILHSHFHHFSPFGGVSGVLVLAESHISIHTWPEKTYAAVDIFMCGSCNPHDSLDALKSGFKAARIEVVEQRRGIIT